MNMRALLGTAIFTTLSAYAQTTQTGPPLQNTPNLDALYGQVLNAYLDAHMIPQADYAEISASLGPDFTAEVYALEMSTLIGIISKAASPATSGIEDVLLTIAGTSHCKASRMGIPNPSKRDA